VVKVGDLSYSTRDVEVLWDSDRRSKTKRKHDENLLCWRTDGVTRNRLNIDYPIHPDLGSSKEGNRRRLTFSRRRASHQDKKMNTTESKQGQTNERSGMVFFASAKRKKGRKIKTEKGQESKKYTAPRHLRK